MRAEGYGVGFEFVHHAMLSRGSGVFCLGITFSFDGRNNSFTLNQLLDRIIQRSAFPKILDVNREFRKIAILRIVLGAVLFVRYFEILDTLIVLKDPLFLVYFGLIILGFTALFTIGLFTNLATLAIAALAIYYDSKVGTSTLGTAISVLLLVPFILVNSGQEYSVDKWLIKKKSWIFLPVVEVASWFGTRNPNLIVRYYFIGFLLYATVSFGALFLHIQDSFWIHGLTTKSLLLNSFLCKHYNWFRWIDVEIPGLLSVLSISATVFQSIFQFLMVPLIFFKPGRRYVFWWGMNFFLISLFFINLSYLPHLEIIYWLLVLSPGGTIGGDFLSKRIGGNRAPLDKEPHPDIAEIAAMKKPFLRNVRLRKFLADKIVFIYVVFIIGYFLFRCPYIRNVTNWIPGIQAKANKVLIYTGFDVPNVFNKTDLAMGDTWMELYRKVGDKWVLTPLTGKEGERGTYAGFDMMHFTNHNSDLLYFGTTLRFRRLVLYHDIGECLQPDQGCGKGLKRLLRYDYLENDLKGDVEYKIRIQANKTSHVTHDLGMVGQYAPKLVLESFYRFNGVDLLEVER